MMSQQLEIMPHTARCQHHTGSLALLWHTKEGSDVTIYCSDGVELKAHRHVLDRSSWMANTMTMQRPSPTTETDHLQLEEPCQVVRPLIAFCYGIELPPLKKGSRSEAQLRTLVDIYHINHYKYQIPKLKAVCEAALANPDPVESPCNISHKSPMHGVISRVLGHQRERRAATMNEETGISYPGRRLDIGESNLFDCERTATTILEVSSASMSRSRHPLDERRLTLLEKRRTRRDSVFSASISRDNKGKFPAKTYHSRATHVELEPELQGITISSAPQMARLRDRSPGGTPYTSPQLYHEIVSLLRPSSSSPMLSAPLPSARTPIERLSASFDPNSSDTLTSWDLSMSPLLEDTFSPSEETLHLVPRPLRVVSKRRTNGAGAASSSLFGPRPLPESQFSGSNGKVQEVDLATLACRPSRVAVREGVFASLRDATRRAFNGKSKQ